MKYPTLSLPAALALALALATPRAQAAPPDLAQASMFFDAGAQAYRSGGYLVAAEAFLKAHEIAPSPALLFSAAQAYRRQYLSEPSPDVLHRAVALYREYLKTDKDPKRREDAMQALAALVPLDARAGAPEGDAAREPPRKTRLLVTTPIDGAQVSVDGGTFARAPLVAIVQPGKHRVHVRAPGCEDEELDVQAVANELVPRHVPLRPKPARLVVKGSSGAHVSVDGQLRATLPASEPITLDPGAHFVAVTQTGHVPFSKTVELGRDADTEIDVDLRSTGQRKAAWATLAVGAAAGVASGILTGLAVARQNEALGLEPTKGRPPITPTQRDLYNGDLQARNDLVRAAAITGGAAAGVLLTGLGMFVFDRPDVVRPSDDRKRAPEAPARGELEVGLLSVGVRVTF